MTIYLEALQSRLLGKTLHKVRLASPFVLRTVEPSPRELEGKTVRELRRLGKRIAFGFEDELFLVIHLMIAGRFKWLEPGAKVPAKLGLAAFDFDSGTLLLTEAGSKRRASIHIVRGEAALEEHDRKGLEPLTMSLDEFRAALTRERHTLKRALTDPRLFSGIGNAYSDEILHAARTSPFALTRSFDAARTAALHTAILDVLAEALDGRVIRTLRKAAR